MSIDYQDLIDELKAAPTLKEVLDDDLCVEVDEVDSGCCELTALELSVNYSDHRKGQSIEVESFSVVVPTEAVTTSFEIDEEDRVVLLESVHQKIMEGLEACLHTQPDDGVGPQVTELEQTIERLLGEVTDLREANDKYADQSVQYIRRFASFEDELRHEKAKRKLLVDAILVIKEQSEEFGNG